MTRVLSTGRMKPSPAEALARKYEAPTLPPPGRTAMERVVLENLDRFLADGALVTPVP
ncbi:hypothetical protein LWC35_34000 [Pseudonocardia kujensis]|uniref:hypothetical protein n=1 Tax=Pseudonocardia kujensis TaxID=1128675 RepID=UPI001E2D9E9A|nr:hypothetical protein [Pseudonocardia kujensis]MCE0767877.1 hypothetical protein [Pseudonocardia kujensis]